VNGRAYSCKFIRTWSTYEQTGRKSSAPIGIYREGWVGSLNRIDAFLRQLEYGKWKSYDTGLEEGCPPGFMSLTDAPKANCQFLRSRGGFLLARHRTTTGASMIYSDMYHLWVPGTQRIKAAVSHNCFAFIERRKAQI